MISRPVSARKRLLWGVSSVCLFVAVYAALSRRQHQINPTDTIMPGPSQLAAGVWQAVTPDARGRVWLLEDFKASGLRLLVGVLSGVSLGFVTGVAMGCYRPLAAFLEPPVSFLSRISPTAMLAIYLVLFGTELEVFVAIISVGIFLTLCLSVYGSVVKDVSPELVYKSYTLGASHMEVITNLVCRQILPRALTSVQLCLGPAVVFLIAAEWSVADVGFGYRLRLQSRLLNMSLVYFYLFVLGAAGWGIDAGLTALRRWLCPWYGE